MTELMLKTWICIQAAVMVPFLIVCAVLFCRAKGSWRERLKMFGGGT